jgi:hypothetical protein
MENELLVKACLREPDWQGGIRARILEQVREGKVTVQAGGEPFNIMYEQKSLERMQCPGRGDRAPGPVCAVHLLNPWVHHRRKESSSMVIGSRA